MSPPAGVAEWQTQRTQNPPVATPWGFKSPLRHHLPARAGCGPPHPCVARPPAWIHRLRPPAHRARCGSLHPALRRATALSRPCTLPGTRGNPASVSTPPPGQASTAKSCEGARAPPTRGLPGVNAQEDPPGSGKRAPPAPARDPDRPGGAGSLIPTGRAERASGGISPAHPGHGARWSRSRPGDPSTSRPPAAPLGMTGRGKAPSRARSRARARSRTRSRARARNRDRSRTPPATCHPDRASGRRSFDSVVLRTTPLRMTFGDANAGIRCLMSSRPSERSERAEGSPPPAEGAGHRWSRLRSGGPSTSRPPAAPLGMTGREGRARTPSRARTPPRTRARDQHPGRGHRRVPRNTNSRSFHRRCKGRWEQKGIYCLPRRGAWRRKRGLSPVHPENRRSWPRAHGGPPLHAARAHRSSVRRAGSLVAWRAGTGCGISTRATVMTGYDGKPPIFSTEWPWIPTSSGYILRHLPFRHQLSSCSQLMPACWWSHSTCSPYRRPASGMRLTLPSARVFSRSRSR